MTKFAIGNREKMLKRGAFSKDIYSNEKEFIDRATVKKGDSIVLHDEDAPTKLLKSFAETVGAKIERATDQLPLTVEEEAEMNERLKNGETVTSIAKRYALSEAQVTVHKIKKGR